MLVARGSSALRRARCPKLQQGCTQRDASELRVTRKSHLSRGWPGRSGPQREGVEGQRGGERALPV